jgi:hypothetical protein
LLVALGLGACTDGGTSRDDRARTQREIDRGAGWIGALTPPVGFRPVPCAHPSSDADRCWRVAGTPDAALDALAPLVASGGFGELEADCEGGPVEPSGAHEPMGCSARPGVLLVSAVRDVDESPTSGEGPVLDTTTVWLGTVHLGD